MSSKIVPVRQIKAYNAIGLRGRLSLPVPPLQGSNIIPGDGLPKPARRAKDGSPRREPGEWLGFSWIAPKGGVRMLPAAILTPATRARPATPMTTPGLRLGLPSLARYAGSRRCVRRCYCRSTQGRTAEFHTLPAAAEVMAEACQLPSIFFLSPKPEAQHDDRQDL